jgi:hypothetical protein
MNKEKKPLLSDEFLTDLVEEINEQYGFDEFDEHHELRDQIHINTEKEK